MRSKASYRLDERWSMRMHVILLAASVLTYSLDRVDVVWRFAKDCPHSRTWEHLCFGLAAAVLGCAAWLNLRLTLKLFRRQEERHAFRKREAQITILHALGIASLLPITGALLLIMGEFLRVLAARKTVHSIDDVETIPRGVTLRLFSKQVAPCCAFFAMLTFSVTLIDRLGELLFAGTALISLLVSSRALMGETSGRDAG